MPAIHLPLTLSEPAELMWYRQTAKWQLAEAAMQLALELERRPGRTLQATHNEALWRVMRFVAEASRHDGENK